MRWRNHIWCLMLAVTLVVAMVASSVLARPKPLSGPVPAFVERVVDGDTLVVRARIWLGQELRVMVRISGIDTPELRGRCAHERKLARAARDFVKQRVGQRKIVLSDIRQGKYAGRVIAVVTDVKGGRLARQLLRAHLARPYKRGRRGSWCVKPPLPGRRKSAAGKDALSAMGLLPEGAAVNLLLVMALIPGSPAVRFMA